MPVDASVDNERIHSISRGQRSRRAKDDREKTELIPGKEIIRGARRSRRFIARRTYLRAMQSPEQSQDLQAEEKPEDEIPPDPAPRRAGCRTDSRKAATILGEHRDVFEGICGGVIARRGTAVSRHLCCPG
ncbi:MAG: hypothetical protein QOI53_2922 [Verrucomicrobiota bacterium]|nr:hypothetical protein [Verrucomicrobiota bacterium]